MLRDAPMGSESPMQIDYMNLLMGNFQRKLIKAYSHEAFSEADKASLRKNLERIFEAKSVATAEEPKGGFYKREA